MQTRGEEDACAEKHNNALKPAHTHTHAHNLNAEVARRLSETPVAVVLVRMEGKLVWIWFWGVCVWSGAMVDGGAMSVFLSVYLMCVFVSERVLVCLV